MVDYFQLKPKLEGDIAKIVTPGKSIVVVEVVFNHACHSIIVAIIVKVPTALSIVDHKAMIISDSRVEK